MNDTDSHDIGGTRCTPGQCFRGTAEIYQKLSLTHGPKKHQKPGRLLRS